MFCRKIAGTVIAIGRRKIEIDAPNTVSPIRAVDGPEEALRRANDTDYGLTAAIFTRNIALAFDLAKRRHVPHQRHAPHKARHIRRRFPVMM
jgi:hypothetical protein